MLLLNRVSLKYDNCAENSAALNTFRAHSWVGKKQLRLLLVLLLCEMLWRFCKVC